MYILLDNRYLNELELGCSELLSGYGAPHGVLCAMCKIHLFAMCYVSFCSHWYVKLK